MLDLIEKVQYGVSILVVLVAVGLYAWQGPAGASSNSVAGVKKIESKAPAPMSLKAPGGAKSAAPAPAAANPSDQSLLDRLKVEQGVKSLVTGVKHEDYAVPKELFQHIKRPANWQPELDKATHVLMDGPGGSTQLKVTSIDPDSILTTKLGIQAGDIVQFIDGEKIDFAKSSYSEHVQRCNRLLEKVEKGGTISITVMRGGQPTQLTFKLD
jgi:hypothetical protein